MLYVAPLEMNEGNSLEQGYNRPTGCSAEKPHTRPLTFLHKTQIRIYERELKRMKRTKGMTGSNKLQGRIPEGKGKGKTIPVHTYYRRKRFQETEDPRFRYNRQ